MGERSLLAAELVAADRPQVKRLAELVYPEGVSISQPAELAKILAHFLKDNQFSTLRRGHRDSAEMARGQGQGSSARR